jgi:hypothetical protein
MVRRGRQVASLDVEGVDLRPQRERAVGKNLGMRAPRLATTEESVPAPFLWSGARQARRSTSQAPTLPSLQVCLYRYMYVAC